MTLSDLEKLDMRGPFFTWISVQLFILFDLKQPILVQNTWGGACF